MMARIRPFPTWVAWLTAHPTIARWVLAAPVAICSTLFVMLMLPQVFPPGLNGGAFLLLPFALVLMLWAAVSVVPAIAGPMGLSFGVVLGLALVEMAFLVSVFQ